MIIHKKHFIKESYRRVHDYVYLCNQATMCKDEKMHYQWKYVTCKNCNHNKK